MVSRTSQILNIFVLGLMLSACGATLDSRPIVNEPSKGVIYSLPFTQFTGSVNYQLISCDGDLDIAANIKAEPTQVTDEFNMYSISPSDLSKFWNKTSLTVEMYENSLALKSINAEVEDQTVATFNSVVSVASSIASAKAPIKVASALSTAAAPNCKTDLDVEWVCKVDVLATFPKILTAEQALTDATEKLSDANSELVSLDSLIADLGDNVSQSVLARLANLKIRISKHSALVSDAESKLALLQGPLGSVKGFSFPQKSTVFTSGVIELSAADVDEWVEPVIVPTVCNRAGTPEFKKLQKELQDDTLRQTKITKVMDLDQYKLKLKIQGTDDYNVTKFVSSKKCGSLTVAECLKKMQLDNGGIYYRNPRPGRLVADFFNAANIKPVSNGNISQLGYVNSLEFSTKTLESAKLSAEFTENGFISKYGYTQTKSQAENFKELIEGVSTEYIEYAEAKKGAKKDALTAELEILTAQKSILETQAALSSDARETQQLTAETAKINAKIEKLKAQKLLENL